MSPERVLFNGEVGKVTLPGADGSFMVLNNHAPLVSTLMPGEIVYAAVNAEQRMTIEGGVVEVRNNEVIICLS